MPLAIEVIENGLVGKMSKHLNRLQHGFELDEWQCDNLAFEWGIGIRFITVFRRRKRVKSAHSKDLSNGFV